ncbi:MAG: hypothetical protein WAN36_07270 [Calditrichia bacterium]
MRKHGKKIIDELCGYLGQDLNHPMCRELLLHVEECPECRIYLDTVKMTVSLYRDCNESHPVPVAVKTQLFKRLKLNES